jgi:hypothetical protein
MVREPHGVNLPLSRIKIKYAATYYFLSELEEYLTSDLILDRYLSDYFETAIWDYIRPFPKWTALHMFSSLFAEMVLDADFERASGVTYVRIGSCLSCVRFPSSPAHLLAADLCKIHAIDSSTLDWSLEGLHIARECCLKNGQTMIGSDLEDDWSDWKLQESYEILLSQIAEEMFFVLFANRNFLRTFNEHMAHRIRHLDDPCGSSAHLLDDRNSDQVKLVRKNPPEWAKRAVFFRDRGYCCTCGRNLENSYSPINNAEYDHIIPLAVGGMNDVTNLQLLCKSCNNSKHAHIADCSDIYERWYPIDQRYQPRRADTLESVVLELFTNDDR